MLQPFLEMQPVYLKKLIELKSYYLVFQTYTRALNDPADVDKIDLLFSDYSDPGLAKIHLNAVKHDKRAAIVDLQNEKHRLKMKEMLANKSKYGLYWNTVKDAKELQKIINRDYNDHMRRYIDTRTNWDIAKNAVLKPSVQVTFGELYITLKYGSQTLRIKFEEIESY